jgi:signal transduction histidine kinase
MPDWFYSLHLRLLAAFAIVLGLALSAVSIYSSYATRQELARFEAELQAARESRLRDLVTDTYGQQANWEMVQPALENAGALLGGRVVVFDESGRMVADSHREFSGALLLTRRDVRRLPFLTRDGQVAMIVIEEERTQAFPLGHARPHHNEEAAIGLAKPGQFQRPLAGPQLTGADVARPEPEASPVPEPQFSRLAASFNRSLLWAGLAAGATGLLAISLATRNALSPVRSLTRAARGLGTGDLSHRVTVDRADEVGELARTFNDMADGLEEAEEQRRTLTADVAHELRTPISNLQGYLEAIKDGVLQADQATIENLYQQVRHLSHLVEDLRMLALAETGSLPLYLSPERIDEIAAATVAAFKPRADEKRIGLSVESEGDVPKVSADRTRMGQVIANLIENAVTNTPEGGKVAVRVGRFGPDRIRLVVEDTGIGIPADKLPLIFERFYRVDPSRARATGGAGLGLTIVKRLVEAHRGTVSVDSQVGKGTAFTIELPAAVDTPPTTV